MLISADVAQAKTAERTIIVHGQPYGSREYIGASPVPGAPGYGTDMKGDGRPQAYLVTQPPGSVTQPHFHQTNQFQVFVGGGGTVGKLRCDPITVQYAAAHTPYGPIRAEADGVAYFTLRQEWDSGAKWMPEKRDLLEKGRQRQVVGRAGDGADRAGREEVLIEETPDGLFALRLRLAPGEAAILPDAAAGGGQYHVVASGGLVRDGAVLGPLSIEFASPDAGAIDVAAGADGLELILARFPRKPRLPDS